MSSNNAEDIAKRVLHRLAMHPSLAQNQILALGIGGTHFSRRVRDTIDSMTLTHAYEYALDPRIKVTTNPRLKDHIYIEVSGIPEERKNILNVIESLQGQLNRALGKSGKTIIFAEILSDEEIDLTPRQTPVLKRPGAGSIGLGVPG